MISTWSRAIILRRLKRYRPARGTFLTGPIYVRGAASAIPCKSISST